MRKISVVLILLYISISSQAQSAGQENLAALQKQVDRLQQEVAGLSQRVSSVEQLNIDLRKALDFGQPVATAQGANGVTYKILSLHGDKATKSLVITVQLSTTEKEVDMSFWGVSPSYIDLYGNRKEAEASSVGGTAVSTVYSGAPVNGMIAFTDVNPDTTRVLKLLEIYGQNNYQKERVVFRDLKVEWN